MRKLATIRRIKELLPIPKADIIEVAVVDGWKVVVKKGDFKVGDLALYCEIDSWIPNSLAPFLTKGDAEPREYNGVKGERLRTVKLRGQISQGLLLPVSEVAGNEGDDVTEMFSIQKYEAPVSAQLAGQVKGSFPSFIPKTDQERIQNITDEFAQYCKATLIFEVTEKLEGSSMTVYCNQDDSGVCSRNLDLKETDGNSFWLAARKNDLIQKIKSTGRNLAFQGELVGPGIEGNHYQLTSHEFYLYDIYDIDNGKYLLPEERQLLADQLGIKHVPISIHFILNDQFSVNDILAMATSHSTINNKVMREGVVFKSYTEQISFKAVSNEYLLKHGN